MFVLPGDKIGCVEEFEAGEGVYEENGELYASVAGKTIIEGRIVKIEPINRIPKLERGDVVIGKVIDVRNSIALIKLMRKLGHDRELVRSTIGILHVSNVQSEFLSSIGSVIRFGDIVKAEILDESLKLSIKAREMGVIKSKCSKCRSELYLDGDKLKCPKCGNVESRKVSSDYGKGVP